MGSVTGVAADVVKNKMSTDLPVPETRVLAVASHVRKKPSSLSFFLSSLSS